LLSLLSQEKKETVMSEEQSQSQYLTPVTEQEQSRSLVEEFDSLLEDDRDTRSASQLDPPVYYLQLLHMSSLSEDRRSEAQQQILQLMEEVDNLQAQLRNREQERTQLKEKNQRLATDLDSWISAFKENEQVISELRNENEELRMLSRQFDVLNHNLEHTPEEVTGDVVVPAEEDFSRQKFLSSTPFSRVKPPPEKTTKRRSYSVDFSQVLRTPIIPGVCKECSKRPLQADSSGSQLDSPVLPWCPHSCPSNLTISTKAPVRSSAALFPISRRVGELKLQ